jgi:hypothetical protein
MEPSGMWNEIIRDLKKRMTVDQIVFDLGQDKNFFYDNGLDYGDPSFEELEKYVKDL